MDTKRDQITIKDLMEEIRLITASALSQDKISGKKLRCSINRLTSVLFGNSSTDEKEMERIRKIGTENNRPLTEKDIFTFISNYYSEGEFYSYTENFIKTEDPVSAETINHALFSKIHELYLSVNPYPWIQFTKIADTGEDEYTNAMMTQLFYLFVYICFFVNTKEQDSYKLFSKDIPRRLILHDSHNNHLVSFLMEHKPDHIAHIFLLEKRTDSYTDLLGQLFSEYNFWQKEEAPIRHVSPFASKYSMSEIIFSTLQKNDLVIIDDTISDECLKLLLQTNCRIICTASSYCPKIGRNNFAELSCNQWISLILSALTDDSFALSQLRNAYHVFGADCELYKLVYTYYTVFSKRDSEAARNFLQGVCNSKTLHDLGHNLGFYEHDKWKYSYKIPKVDRASGRYITQAIQLYFKYDLSAGDDFLCELLRLLSLIQEENPAINLRLVCHYFNLDTAFDELIALEWIEPANNYIPPIIAYSVTYGKSMSNKSFDFYLKSFIELLHDHLLGHTDMPVNLNLLSTLIKVIHQELLNYMPGRTDISRQSLQKNYFRKFTKKTIPDNEKISYQDSRFFLEHGYFASDSEENKQDPYTPAIISSTPRLIHFYFSILIFCYEYEQEDLAKKIFSNSDDLSKIFFMTTKGYAKTPECHLLQEYYLTLFGNLPFDKIQSKIAQLLRDSLNNALKQSRKNHPEHLNLAELKIPFFMFLRISLHHMQISLGLFYREPNLMDNYKDLVCDTKKASDNLMKLLPTARSLWEQELFCLYIHCNFVATLYQIPRADMQIHCCSTFFKTHLFISKLLFESYDISAKNFLLGDLKPATARLQRLIYDFHNNK